MLTNNSIDTSDWMKEMKQAMTSRMKRCVAIMLLLVLSIATVACSASNSATTEEQGSSVSTGEREVELLISAAASLKDALEEIKLDYENSHPHIKLNFNYGGSGALQQQIEQGAPVDLFLSASLSNMQKLVDKGLVDQQDNLLANELIVIVPNSSTLSLNRLSDLTSDSIYKIAIGVPESVPAGSYAKEALTHSDLWEPLQANIVQAKDVRQVLQYVETGNVDAGFVYKTDALSSDKVSMSFSVEQTLHSPIVYPIGIINTSTHLNEVKELYEYLQSAEVLNLFSKYGFSSPSES